GCARPGGGPPPGPWRAAAFCRGDAPPRRAGPTTRAPPRRARSGPTAGRENGMPLTARVRTRDGWPVAHAVVTLTDAAGRQVLRVEADADGSVHAPAVPAPGAHPVIVTAVGHAPAAAGALVTDEAAGVQAGTVTLARQGGAELPPPGPWTVDPAHSTVAAVARHLGFSSVRGRFTDYSARFEVAAD